MNLFFVYVYLLYFLFVPCFADLSDLSVELDCTSESKDSRFDDYVGGKEECSDTILEIMIFEAPANSNKRWLDYWPQDGMCCTTEMVEKEL